MLRTLGRWLHDYLRYASRRVVNSFVYRTPPAHYLGHVRAGRCPIIVIPGILDTWRSLTKLVDPLSQAGHPIYVLPHLNYNWRAIPHAAQLVRELIDKKHLTHTVIIAHSKGGLVGKFVLAFHNADKKVRRLIAIATPFAGSRAARFLPGRRYRELSPEHPTIAKLAGERKANRHITSIFGSFDNHVWPTTNCRLEGAKNIQVNVWGHHTILFDPHVRDIVAAEVAATTKNA